MQFRLNLSGPQRRSFAVCFRILFSLLLLHAKGTITWAQSPGGVSSGLKLWIKADASSTIAASGGLVSNWTYANDNSKSFVAPAGAEPTLAAAGLNFLPILVFGGAQMLDGPAGAGAPIAAGDDDYALFAVWKSSSVSSFQRVWSQRKLGPSDAADGFSLATWNTGLYGDQIERNPYSHTVQRPYAANAWNITQLNLLNQATNDLEIADDRNLSTGVQQLNTDPGGTDGPGVRTLTDAVNRIGARDSPTEESLTGGLAELIIFDRPIGATERAKIFSYLALKYGVPIKTNILSSAGTTIWNAGTLSAYNNAVFGIGKDDNSGLAVMQSNSLITGSGDGTGQSGAGNIILSNPANLDNQEFLLIGNDNAALSEVTANLPSTVTAAARRLERNWKVQHTGNIGAVDLTFDLGGLSITGAVGTAADFRLMIDADGDGNFTTGTPVYYTPTGFTGNRINFTGVILGNNAVFTILTKASFSAPLHQAPDAATITSPVANASVSGGASLTVTATASDPDHDLSKVEFYDGTTKLGESAGPVYSFTWSYVPPGSHTLTAKAIDATGLSLTSSAVNISASIGPGTVWLSTGNAGILPATNFLGTTDAQPLVFKTNNTQNMTITPDGNVGIGTSAPLTKLHVEGQLFQNGDLRLGQQKDDVGYGKRLTFDDNGNTDPLWFSRYNTAPDYSELRANLGDDGTSDRFVIGFTDQTNTWVPQFTFHSDGRMGIGTDQPGSFKLAVEGNIGARAVKVTPKNPWPDYVFHKNYRLLPLSEIETYIASHNHLPGVPTAGEITRNGLDLGDNQGALLKKIEELTLYLIEQDKKVKSLEEKLEAQQSTIAELKKRADAGEIKKR